MVTPQKSVICGFILEPPLRTEPELYTLNVLILGFLSQNIFIEIIPSRSGYPSVPC